jgi:hypothetical protein
MGPERHDLGRSSTGVASPHRFWYFPAQIAETLFYPGPSGKALPIPIGILPCPHPEQWSA